MSLIPWNEYRHAPPPGTHLCLTGDIVDGGVREFRFGGDSPFAFRLFIYNDGGIFKAYRNACPHFDVPLNHKPDELFTPDGRYFQCTTHYAIFAKDTGFCVEGPCQGESLQAIPLVIDGDRLLIAGDNWPDNPFHTDGMLSAGSPYTPRFHRRTRCQQTRQPSPFTWAPAWTASSPGRTAASTGCRPRIPMRQVLP